MPTPVHLRLALSFMDFQVQFDNKILIDHYALYDNAFESRQV